MLIGAGDEFQEGLDTLESIYKVAKSNGKALKDVVNLTVVDNKSKSEIKIDYEHYKEIYPAEVVDFARDFLSTNPRAIFETPIETFATEQKFDIVLCDNVVQYLGTGPKETRNLKDLEYFNPIKCLNAHRQANLIKSLRLKKYSHYGYDKYIDTISRIVDFKNDSGIVFMEGMQYLEGFFADFGYRHTGTINLGSLDKVYKKFLGIKDKVKFD